MSLISYYKENFALVQHHKWSLSEIENMIPFEKDIYTNLLLEYLDKLEEERNKAKR